MAEQQPGTVFVGRDSELRELLHRLDEAGAGRGRLILLAGEPGIGKSRLADELATRAREQGRMVLWGRGWEDAGAPPYWPWVQALRTYLRNTPRDQVRTQMAYGAGDIAQILPEVRDIFPEVPTASASESDAARFQLFDSMARFLHDAARARRLLIVVDDLHAADTPSIRFLRFLSTQLAEMPLLVVGTYRDMELTPEHPLTASLGELAREPITTILTLGGLGRRAVDRIIGATAGTRPSDRLVTAVWRETKGNPLFLAEAVRLLTAEGQLTDGAGMEPLHLSVPASVREAIARRIDHQLSGPSARALELAAALGPEFSFEVLRRVGNYEVDDALDLIDEAVRAGLLVSVGGSLRKFRFSHDLVRETVYDGLPPGRRVRLHQHVAEVLEELYARAPEARLAEMAHHFFEASRGGEGGEELVSRATAYARRAAEHAARSLAYEEAARLYRMALALLDAQEPVDAEARTEILLALGDAESRAGDMAGSAGTFLQAAKAARRTGSARQLARAALGMGGRVPWGRPGRQTHLIPMLQDALVHVGGDDDRLRVRLLSRLACAWRSSPEQREQSDTLSGQAVELARRIGDAASLSYALSARFWAIWWPENPEQRAPLAAELVRLAEMIGDSERLMDAHLMRWLIHTESGDMVEARRSTDEIARLAEELRQPQRRWLGAGVHALTALMLGDFARAEELIESQAASGVPFTLAGDDISAWRMWRFLLSREQGRLEGEKAAVRASVQEFPWYPLHRSALALLLIELGRVEEARDLFATLARDEFSIFYRDNMWLLGISMASEACALLDDRATAATLYGQLAPFAGRHAIGHAEGSVGAVDRYLGLLAATLGRLDDAVQHLDEAVAMNQRMGARPWTAHAQHDLARVLRRRDSAGDRERAAELEAAALVTAHEIGMPALELSLAGAGSATEAPARLGHGHFRREGEYWTVGFDGPAFRLRDAKGMAYLARLLAHPGRELHALDLVQAIPTATGRRASPELSVDPLGDAGPHLDASAKAAYRERLNELEAELREAEEWNDTERAARARQEREFIARELSGAVGLGGRDRRAAAAAERARISVTRAIRGALQRITEQSPALGSHFAATIHTGTFCSYTPDPRVPMDWQL
jgi:tetratricopeptide (TPR) repeat protein